METRFDAAHTHTRCCLVIVNSFAVGPSLAKMTLLMHRGGNGRFGEIIPKYTKRTFRKATSKCGKDPSNSSMRSRLAQ